MIKGLHRKLTAFNTFITGAILLGMTLLCLFVSERDTYARAFQTFSDNLTTASAYLEGQNRLSVTWLQKMEGGGRNYISIRDGNNPLFSVALSSQRSRLAPEFQKARIRAQQEYGLSTEQGGSGSCAFSLNGEVKYYAGLALVPKNGTVLEIIILYPLTALEQSIHRQWVVVAVGEILALGLLWAFSWYFTGKLLRPIAENQQRQARFTAAASHELRTPLAAILSAADVIEQLPPDQQAHFSQIIQREGQRMTRLIGDMLTLASADSQNWEIHPEKLEPDMLALGVYESFQPQAKEKGLALTLTLPEESVPAGYYDKDRIGQVLSILLSNAISYTPPPGTVGLTLECRKNAVRFLVSDTGPGVPDEEKKKIFERFYRGETARPGRTHFGLGLCIASEITRLHQGRLWVEDNAGGGSVFILELPLP